MAKAGVEMAVNDLLAQALGKPLWQILKGTQEEIPAGISLGVEESIPALLRQVEKAVAKKYHRVKMKIRPGWDVEPVREVRRAFPALRLMVDANGAYELKDAEHLRALDEFQLMMLEQPLYYEDLLEHAELQKSIRTPICLDESIRSYRDARGALELGSCSIINIKQARVGGTFAAKIVHNVAKARGVPVWCGGLLETGIGRAHNIALASLPGFTLPGDISASERYYAEDVIDPPVTVTPRGTIVAPKGPGIGYNVVERRLARYCVRREFVLS